MEHKTNGLCTAGFVISLVSLILCFPISILGFILSIAGVVKANKNGEDGRGLGIAGIIISAFMMIFTIVVFCIVLFTGVLGTVLTALGYSSTVASHNSSVAEELDKDSQGRYEKDFGTYTVDTDWEEVDYGSNYYVYCYEGTFSPNKDIPNNIMVTHDSNPYAEDDHMTFRDAIMAQISAQAGESDDLDTVNAHGTTTDSGAIVYVFDMKGEDGEKVQYYIVGDYEYVCVSAMIWDFDAAEDDDILDVVEEIVNSFVWENKE